MARMWWHYLLHLVYFCALGLARVEDASYSFSLTTFSPKGSLSQIEYAMKAVDAGATSVAVKFDSGAVLASQSKPPSVLVRAIGGKLTHITDSSAMAYAGVAADSRVLATSASSFASRYRARYGEGPVALLPMVGELAAVMQEYTQMAGVRPFGVSVLLAGEQGEEVLVYRVDPSGYYSPWKAAAIGRGAGAAQRLLQVGYKESLGAEEALALAVAVLQWCANEELELSEMETCFVRCSGITNQPHLSMDEEELNELLREVKSRLSEAA
ncbi:unnamed protein product [Chrysoparadoxa australica]